MTTSIEVREANLALGTDASAVVDVLDSYASDPRGGGTPLAADVRARLVPALRAHPTTLVLLAFDGSRAVGLLVGFWGLGTFAARPLLNIHDLAVVPGQRGRGIGPALLTAAEARARNLYGRFGFRDVRYGDSGPTMFLAMPLD